MPSVLVFDVNETLSDLRPMAARFEEVGLPGHLVDTWFAGLLRDGFALTAVGATAPFATLGRHVLGSLWRRQVGGTPPEAAVDHVMDGFLALGVHEDVPDGVRALRELGLRLVTLSNGAAEVAQRLLSAAGLEDLFEAVLTVEDAGVWKPAPAAYAHALERCGVQPHEATLVAVHPWDTDGARRAGLASAWVNRHGEEYPGHFLPPTWQATSLVSLADALGAGAGDHPT